LRIRLAQPDADFLQKLAFPAASVVEQRAHGAGLPAGTGPWRLAGRNRDGSLTLLPRPHYFGGKLHLKSLLLIPVSGDPRALDLYRRGELDAARVSPARYPSLSTRPDFSGSDGLDAYYAVPEGASLLPLAVAIDRARVVARVGPSLTSLDAIVPPAVPDYVSSPPSLGGEEGERLPALAVQVVPRSDPVAQALGRALSASAGQQGTDPLHVRLIHARYLLPDPGLWLRLVLPETHSRWFRSLLPAADRLSNDPVTRMDAYSRLETWALERGLIVPLATASVNYVIKPAVQNLEVTPAGLMPENGSWATVSVT
jgi:hypothetical protein